MPKLCSAHQPGRGSRDVGGDYQGISSPSLIFWAHQHRAGSWRVSEEPLKCPSSGVSNCSANNSTLAVFEWDTTGQGAWMPSRGTSTQLPPNFYFSQGDSTQQYAGKWCLGCWGGRALWAPPSTFNVQLRKEKQPGRIVHVVFLLCS